jgi:hypothetical protein
MITRRKFLQNITATTAACAALPLYHTCRTAEETYPYAAALISDFYKRLKPVGRILETKGWYVWCNTPVYDQAGRVHLFYSRWLDKYGMGGWIHKCEIAHAVADRPEGPYEFVETVLAPRTGYFDATTCHNPHIQFVDGKYCLFYMGNCNGKTDTKRIGLATADSLFGPWQRPDEPLLPAGTDGAWDDHCTTNPAFVKHPNGQFWLYYKAWNSDEYENAAPGSIRGNRKYGLAIADQLTGPYAKYEGNPVIDFSGEGANQQLEDAYVWFEDGKFKLIARDMGFFDHYVGLIFESENGLNWSLPKIAYAGAKNYVDEPPAPKHLRRYGRFERPQLLMKEKKPEYLFTTAQGGKHMTASGFVFKIA